MSSLYVAIITYDDKNESSWDHAVELSLRDLYKKIATKLVDHYSFDFPDIESLLPSNSELYMEDLGDEDTVDYQQVVNNIVTAVKDDEHNPKVRNLGLTTAISGNSITEVYSDSDL